VIGECVRDFHRPEVRVLGVASTPTDGVRRDQVTDLEAATDTVRRALQEAELMAGIHSSPTWRLVAIELAALEAARKEEQDETYP